MVSAGRQEVEDGISKSWRPSNLQKCYTVMDHESNETHFSQEEPTQAG